MGRIGGPSRRRSYRAHRSTFVRRYTESGFLRSVSELWDGDQDDGAEFKNESEGNAIVNIEGEDKAVKQREFTDEELEGALDIPCCCFFFFFLIIGIIFMVSYSITSGTGFLVFAIIFFCCGITCPVLFLTPCHGPEDNEIAPQLAAPQLDVVEQRSYVMRPLIGAAYQPPQPVQSQPLQQAVAAELSSPQPSAAGDKKQKPPPLFSFSVKPRAVNFLLDVSGSMWGDSIDTCRTILSLIYIYIY